MNKTTVIFALAALMLAGCASEIKRGHVVMKTGDEVAHIATGPNELQAGDHIQLYHNECTGGVGKSGMPRECKKVNTGHGEVTKILSPDYAEVKFADGAKFTEGDTIEKHAH